MARNKLKILRELKRLRPGSTRWILRGGLGLLKERLGPKTLSPCDLLVLVGMADRAEGDGLCFIDQTLLADGLGISRGAVQKSQTKLRKLGVIVPTKDIRRGRAAVYRISADAHRIGISEGCEVAYSTCNLNEGRDAHRVDAKYLGGKVLEADSVADSAAARGSIGKALRAAEDNEKQDECEAGVVSDALNERVQKTIAGFAHLV